MSAGAGDLVVVETSTGQMEVTVPDGVSSGDTFEIELGDVSAEIEEHVLELDSTTDALDAANHERLEKAEDNDQGFDVEAGEPFYESAATEEQTETLLVACPTDSAPGDVLVVTTSTGQDVEVAIPDGVGPGDEFEVTVALGLLEVSTDDKNAFIRNSKDPSACETGSGEDVNLEVEQHQQIETQLHDEDTHEEKMETLLVTCPEGMLAGEVLHVMTSAGQEVEVTIPDGVDSGDDFEVTVHLGDDDDGVSRADVEDAAALAEAEAELARLEAEAEKLEQLDENEHALAESSNVETLLIVCPEGVDSGDLLLVVASTGEDVEVEVPEGVMPGDEFEVNIQL